MIPLLDPSRPIVTENATMTEKFRFFMRLVTETLNLVGDNTVEAAANLPDGASIQLDPGKAGYGEIMAGDNLAWATFRFSSDGTVTVNDGTSNVINSDSAGYLCVYNVGGGVAIKNRLGSAYGARYSIKYMG